jgi:DNA-binding FadR family transcriptional regulator
MARNNEYLLHHLVARQLGQQILRGDLPPGQVLPDVETLGAVYGVSRTVLREAIKMLTAKGMVVSQPRIGVTVTPRSQWSLLDTDVMRWRIDNGLDRAFIYDVLTMRRIIEPGGAELAAASAPDQVLAHLPVLYDRVIKALDRDRDQFIIADAHFHCGILLAGGSELLSQMTQLIEIAVITVASSTAHIPDGPRSAMPVHKAVLDAVCRRSPAAAASLMRELVDITVEQVDRLFQQPPLEVDALLADVTADTRRLLDPVSRSREAQLSLVTDSTA